MLSSPNDESPANIEAAVSSLQQLLDNFISLTSICVDGKIIFTSMNPVILAETVAVRFFSLGNVGNVVLQS